ncbi:RNA polymerase sigma factor [Bacillaceae bacterium W0354]
MTWEKLYELYSDKIYNYILLQVGKEDLAEDLTHDVFIRANNSLKKFRNDSNYDTWLITIARNLVYDYWRRKRKFSFSSLSAEIKGNYETPESLYEKSESIAELYQALLTLKHTYKEVIIL